MEKAIDLTVLPPPNQGPLPLVQRLLLTLNCQVGGRGSAPAGRSWWWLATPTPTCWVGNCGLRIAFRAHACPPCGDAGVLC